MYSSVKNLAAAVGLVLALAGPAQAQMAGLLPNGKQTFVDQNGQPIAGGTVNFYVPGGTTPKTTWVDSGEAVANANPVVLDAAGRAVIYGSGQYRELVKDQYGNIIWDQLTNFTAPVCSAFGTTAGTCTQGNDSRLAPAYFSVYLNNDQTFGSGTVQVQYDTVELDSSSGWDVSDHRFVPNRAGKWLFSTSCNLDGNFTAVQCMIYKNGLPVRSNTSNPSVSAGSFAFYVSGIISMNGTTDYVDVHVQATGSSVFLNGATDVNPPVQFNEFWGNYISQ